MSENQERKKKSGRPPLENKRNKMVRIRVTENEMKELKKLAGESGMNVSDFFRFLVWGEIK